MSLNQLITSEVTGSEDPIRPFCCASCVEVWQLVFTPNVMLLFVAVRHKHTPWITGSPHVVWMSGPSLVHRDPWAARTAGLCWTGVWYHICPTLASVEVIFCESLFRQQITDYPPPPHTQRTTAVWVAFGIRTKHESRCSNKWQLHPHWRPQSQFCSILLLQRGATAACNKQTGKLSCTCGGVDLKLGL